MALCSTSTRIVSSKALLQSASRHFTTSASRLAEEHHEDISDHVKTVSKLSGAGPFAAQPDIKLLGSPFTSALHVCLPGSSKVNLKNGAAVVGVTGTVTTPSTQLNYSTATDDRKGSASLPFVYQTLTSENALTLLVSAPTRPQKSSWYALVEPSKSFDWVVRRDAVLAWSGPQLDLRPVSAELQKSISNFITSPIHVRGDKGKIALTNHSLIHEYKLSAGEQVFFRQGSILGLTVPKSSASLLDDLKTVHRVQHLPLAASFQELLPAPLQGAPDTIKAWGAKLKASLPAEVKPTLESVASYWNRAFSAVQKTFSTYLWQDDELVRVSGPATVLIDHTPPSLVTKKLRAYIS